MLIDPGDVQVSAVEEPVALVVRSARNVYLFFSGENGLTSILFMLTIILIRNIDSAVPIIVTVPITG